jgi:hypothetical protein
VNEAALVELAHSRGHTDGQAQEASHLHGRAEQPLERLAARILKHQNGPTTFAYEFQWSHRPRTVQLILQPEFAGEAIEAGGWRVFGGGQHDQHDAAIAVGAQTPSSAERAFAVLPQELEAVTSLSTEPK